MRYTLALLAFAALATTARAQSASQDVRIYATDITGLTLTDDAVDIPLDALDLTGTNLTGTGQSGMSIQTNILLYKISAQLDEDYSEGVELAVSLDFSEVGLPGGIDPLKQTLSADESKDLVVGLSPLATSDIIVDYEATAPLTVGTDYDDTSEVTFTITSVIGL